MPQAHSDTNQPADDAEAETYEPKNHHLFAFGRVQLLEVELPVPGHHAPVDIVLEPQGSGHVAIWRRQYDHRSGIPVVVCFRAFEEYGVSLLRLGEARCLGGLEPVIVLRQRCIQFFAWPVLANAGIVVWPGYSLFHRLDLIPVDAEELPQRVVLLIDSQLNLGVLRISGAYEIEDEHAGGCLVDIFIGDGDVRIFSVSHQSVVVEFGRLVVHFSRYL